MGALKYEIRHYQFQDAYPIGVPYWWTGATPSTITKTYTSPAGWLHTYFDVTTDVLSDKFEVTYGTKDTNTEANHREGVSQEVTFGGIAGQFIHDWLYGRSFSALNAIELKVTDLGCNMVIGEFICKASKSSQCLLSDCTVTVTAQTNDYYLDCVSKIKISDNRNGFLNNFYRAYAYAVEKRPAVFTALLFTIASLIGIIVIPALALGTFLDFVLSALGFSTPPFPTLGDYQNFLYNIVGLGRCHAAASAQQYITNVCDICQVEANTDKVWNWALLQKTDIIYAQSTHGKETDDPNRQVLRDENIPVIALSDLLNSLAKQYNSYWYINNGVLNFRQNTTVTDPNPVIFAETLGNRLIGLCLSVGDNRPPLTLHIEYGQDPIDLLTHDAIPRYSSTAAFTSDNTVTPLLKGNETIVSDFGATRFLDDGITESYISAAINNPLVYLGVFAVIFLIALIIANALGLIASLTVGAAVGVLITTAGVVLLTSAIGYIAGSVYLAGTTTYAIVASQDIWTMGKIVTWDETSAPADAVVKDYGAGSTKLPNLLYNPTGQSYDTVHTENAVIPTTTLRNYNNFADCRFQETLWDDFMTKDPRVSANANREVTITFAACCEELVALGLFQNLEVAISRIVSYAGLMPSRVGEVANNSAVIKTIKVDYYTQVVEIIGYEYVEQ